MNSKSKVTTRENKPRISASTLMRLAGVAALVAGGSAIVVGMSHPLNIPSSVTTALWANVHIFAITMAFFGLFGMVGLYVRQAEKSGWLGMAGFIMLSLWFALMLNFGFVETFILPVIADGLPKFVVSFLGMFTGAAAEMDLGLLPTVWSVTGPMLILGSLLFGIATFRAAVLPRWAGALLAIGAVLIPTAAFLPAEHEAKILLPVGLALAWMGYALLTERREKSSATVLDRKTTNPEATGVA